MWTEILYIIKSLWSMSITNYVIWAWGLIIISEFLI